jgi:uncharacterized protein (DUF885 family)
MSPFVALHGVVRMILALTRLLLALVFLVMFSALAHAADEDSKLTAFFKTYLDEEMKQSPFTATRLGVHDYDDRLDDLSAKAIAAGRERTKAALADLPQKIDYQKLSRSGQIDFEIFKHDLTRSVWLADNFKPFENDPLVYNEYISDSIYLLLTQSSLPRATNVKNAVSRMAFIPKVVEAAKANLRNPPLIYVETAIRRNKGAIGFHESGIYEVAGETPQLSEIKPVAAKVLPALKDYQKFLEEDLLPRAKGQWRIGQEKFARKLELELDAGLTAEQVLKDAQTEFERVERDMYVIARQLWGTTFPGKPLPADTLEGRRATIRNVLEQLNKDHGKPEDLVKDAKATIAAIKQFITEKDILRLPDPDRCQVLEMPEFQRGFSVAYLNNAPPLDNKANSVYAVSPPPKEWDARKVESYLQEYNQYMLQILTIHEGFPGHYVQLEYSSRHPSVIRRVLYSGVFAEGWAVYTEQTMLDQGYGKGDLALRLNQLKFYLRAVANTILDHKMHCDNLSDEEALKFLTERVYQSEGEALGKIVRAKLSSCQLSTYFVGRMAFYRLRQEVQKEQGDKFDLGRYHEAVLDHGTLPVKYLAEVVRDRLAKPR